jgi:uncharacterized protein YbaR (Trm112 family)
MHEHLLRILRCPEDGSSLAPAGADLIDRLNSAIAEGRLHNRGGKRVEAPLDGGFVRAAGDVLYPVVDQIPVLLCDEATAM